jgi:hypothetical protein
MNFISNWQEVLQKAWSVRFAIAAAVLGGMEAFFLAMSDYAFGAPPGMFAGLAALCGSAAVFARIWDQPTIAPKDVMPPVDDTLLPRI